MDLAGFGGEVGCRCTKTQGLIEHASYHLQLVTTSHGVITSVLDLYHPFSLKLVVKTLEDRTTNDKVAWVGEAAAAPVDGEP